MLCDFAVVLLCLVGEEEWGEGVCMWLGWVVLLCCCCAVLFGGGGGGCDLGGWWVVGGGRGCCMVFEMASEFRVCVFYFHHQIEIKIMCNHFSAILSF